MPHPVGKITQPTAHGVISMRRYGSFAGRQSSVVMNESLFTAGLGVGQRLVMQGYLKGPVTAGFPTRITISGGGRSVTVAGGGRSVKVTGTGGR